MELAASAGLVLDPWQALVLQDALGERPDGRWAATDVGCVVGRQNGKNAILEAREIGGLFLLEEELILHSSHEFKTSADGFRRVLGVIQGSNDLNSRVSRVATSHGSEGIELKPTTTIIAGSGSSLVKASKTPRLRFVARTSGSGRGFSADCIILDEAYNLPEHALSALMPTMAARPNPQMWYTSSAVNAEHHLYGLVLARVRRRGHAGDDPGLAYFEWSADDAEYARLLAEDPAAAKRFAADPDIWAQANPGLGIRITEEHVARELRSLGSKAFAVERLSIGDWPPEPSDEVEHVLDMSRWAHLIDRTVVLADPVVFAVDVAPDRSAAAIAVAGRRPDDGPHVEIVDARKGVAWVVDRVQELQEKWHPAAWVLDPSGPVGSLIPSLAAVGIKVETVTAREHGQACGDFYDLVMAEREQYDIKDPIRLSHMGDERLTAALDGAAKRDVGDLWLWDRRTFQTNLAPLVAATLAIHGLSVYGRNQYDVMASIF